VVWVLFTGHNAAAGHAPYVIYQGTAAGQWTAVAKEPMTGPKAVEANGGGSYPGPISTLDAASAALVLFTPPLAPNPVQLVFAVDAGHRLSPATPIPVPGLSQPMAASFLSDQAGWILGTKAPTAASPSTDAILATADGGRTWAEQYSRPSPTK
jgi:hypothetical protein